MPQEACILSGRRAPYYVTERLNKMRNKKVPTGFGW